MRVAEGPGFAGQVVTIGDSSLPGVNTRTTWGMSVADPGLPLPALVGIDATPELVWRTQPSVRKVVSFIGREIAGLSWKVYRRGVDDDRVRVSNSPAEILLRQPRKYQTGYALIERAVINLCMTDTMMIVLDADGHPMVVPSHMIVVDADSLGVVQRLGVRTSSGVVDLETIPTAFLTGWSSWSGQGTSPLRTIRDILSEQADAVAWRRKQWADSPKLSGIVKRPAGARWEDAEKERWIQGWREYREGKAGGTPIFEDGMEYQSLVSELKPVDAKDIEGRTLTDVEVASFFHVPPELVGARQSNFSSIAAFRQMLFGPALGPMITAIEQALNSEIVPALGGQGEYGEFDRDSAMSGSFLEQAQYLQTAVGGPYLTRAEARKALNRPFLDGTDELIVPMNVTEGGLASPRDTGSQNLDAGAEKSSRVRVVVKSDGAKRARGRMEKALSDLYKRQFKSAGDVDEDEWHKKWDSIAERMLQPILFDAAVTGSEQVFERVRKADGGWSPDIMRNYVKAMAKSKAVAVNAGSLAAILDADEEPDDEDDESTVEERRRGALQSLITDVAVAWAASAVADAMGFGAHDAARGNGVTQKTWVVTSANPRPSHAAMDGESVGIDDTFSNGARWPGDGGLDVDETAGCTCVLEYQW